MSRRAAQIEDEARRRALLMGPFGLGRPRRALAAGVPDLVIDDCETLWSSTASGLLLAINAAPTAGGTGYTLGDILTVTADGSGGRVHVTGESGGVVTGLTIYAGGFGGYVVGTGKATSGGTGTGCTVNVTAVGVGGVSRSTSQVAVGTASMRVATTSSTPIPRALLGYYTIAPGSLAAYTKLVVRLYNGVPTMPDTLFRLCLCSDSVGRVVVDEFVVPAVAGEDAFIEHVMSRTGGGALASSVGSIAVYSGTTGGYATGFFYFDDIRVRA